VPLNRATPGYIQLLLRGLLAGLFAGLLAGAFAYLAGEPHVEAAIAIEEAATPAGETTEEPLVDRATQRAVGLPLATGLIGLALGGILATAVGDPGTINQRTAAWLAVVALGLVAVWAGTLAARTQTHQWRRATAGTAGFLAVVTIAYTLLPTFTEVPGDFPATLLWDFRISSLGTQTVLWTVLGITFAALLTRLATRTGTPQTAPVTTA
jgi:lysylphosphatidylglycerol synthetase-like protein (DUF2156 family)